MPLTKVSGEVIQRPLVITGNTAVTGILTVGIGSTTTTLDGTSNFPPIRPSLDFTFAASKTLDRRINFYRTSIGTYTDEHGIIRRATNNVPRFDHDPVTGECLGLLIEESRGNLFTYSEGFNTGWITTNSTIVSNATTSPDGNTNGFLLREDTVSGGHYFYQTGITLSASTTYTFSAFVKRNGRDVVLQINNGNSPLSVSLFTWNLSNGTYVGSSDIVGLAGLTNKTGTITAYPNGWYRITATFTSGTSATGGTTFYIEATDNASVPAAGTPVYTGDGTSGFYVWGAQVEAGSFATSYIPTVASTVTRSADIASISSSNMSWFKPQEGTWAIEVNKTVGFTNIYGALFYIPSPNRQELWKTFGSGTMRYSYFNDSNVSQSDITFSTVLTSGKNKIYAAYKTDDCIVGLNGSSTGTDTSATMQTTLNSSTSMSLFYEPTNVGEFWNGHISRFTYYPKRLTNDQLNSLSRQ